MTKTKESGASPTVTLHSEGTIGIITLRRIQQRNALTATMIEQLITAATTISDDEQVTAVVIEAQGDTFSVGADLNEVSAARGSRSLLRARRDAELGGRLMRSLRDIHQPTVCALQGVAMGGGACIAAACDFRIACADAQIGVGEVRMAMNLMWQAMPYYVDLLGTARAKQLIMSGQLFPAETLHHWGFIDEIAPQGKASAVARRWAKTYADLPPVAVQMIKRSINRYAQALGESIMHMDSDQWLLTAQSEDFQESLEAFKAKRAPKLKGR
ncbi:MAG: enoyl-CoA hydratase/isomerase family protein [Luminiphilus sp.]|nr:enoyl-CoA hydratase/isomerase family protein [Luminiphilus sp.]